MDISRPDLKKKKQVQGLFVLGIVAIVILIGSFGLSRLKPAAPTIDRGMLWTGKVQRGEMLREIRGNGTLVATRILSIQSATGGTVEEILIWPGAEVEPETIILKLSNPELEKEIFDLTWQLRAAEATMKQVEAEIEQSVFAQESAIAIMKSDWEQAKLEAEASESLSEQQLEPAIKVKAARATADALEIKYHLEVRKLAVLNKTARAKSEVQQAELEKLKAQFKLKQSHLEGLQVRANIRGVLQELGGSEGLELGQRIVAGANLAKIIRPENLKAVIKVPETQAKDITIGQEAIVDTRNGYIDGIVTRLDPAVVEGTVALDIKLDGVLPDGVRPDMNVDARVEIERLSDVLFVGRMVNSYPNTTTEVFLVSKDMDEAKRTSIQIGRTSVNLIEIKSGLEVGDTIILSDSSQWEKFDRINIE